MRHSQARSRAEIEQACAEPGRALVAPGASAQEPRHPARGGRPMAGFLTQLIVSLDPSLRPSRPHRTARAASLYARTGRATGPDRT